MSNTGDDRMMFYKGMLLSAAVVNSEPTLTNAMHTNMEYTNYGMCRTRHVGQDHGLLRGGDARLRAQVAQGAQPVAVAGHQRRAHEEPDARLALHHHIVAKPARQAVASNDGGNRRYVDAMLHVCSRCRRSSALACSGLKTGVSIYNVT